MPTAATSPTQMTDPAGARIRAVRTLIITTLLGGLLVATHLGEFWPYSIFPMFSTGGRPWENSLVRAVPGPDTPNLFDTVKVEDLPGEIVPLEEVGVPQRDFAKLLKEERAWDGAGIEKLRTALKPALEAHPWVMVVRVHGPLPEDGEVITEARPFVLVGRDGSIRWPDGRPPRAEKAGAR